MRMLMLWVMGLVSLIGCAEEPGGLSVDGPADLVLLSAQEARDAAAFRATLQKPYDPAAQASWIEAREGLRNLAFKEMLRMPPDEFRAFHLRNGWKERWPELWGPKRGPIGFAHPPAAMDWAEKKPILEAMLAAYDDEEILMRRMFGTPAEAEKWVENSFERGRRYLAEYIEEHARLWPNAESMWRPGRRGDPGGLAWTPQWLPESLDQARKRVERIR